MKKAMYRGIRDIRVEEVPEPAPGPTEVKVAIKYCGICGSDLHEYLHGPFPQPTFGHEACGHITEIGSSVSEHAVGDRVCTVFPGAFAESIVCPVAQLITIPDNADWKRAALLEPLSGAAHAIERGNIQKTDTVLIAGAGSVGLMILLGLKAMGVETVYMTDVRKNRREMALALGASQAFDPAKTRIPAEIKSLTQERGVDVSVEAVGIEATLKDCLAATRPRGTVIVQGIFTERAKIHMLGFVTRETTMIGTSSINPQLAISWLASGKIAPEQIVTDIIALQDITKKGFERLAAGDESAIKILVEP